MIHSLRPFSSRKRIKLDVAITRHEERLDLAFTLYGALPADLAEILLRPLVPAAQRQRRDEIWKSTCFELFFGPAETQEYVELNLCPSGDWNMYLFDGYRSGMRKIDGAKAPLRTHETSVDGDRKLWTVRVEAPAPTELARILASPSLVMGAAAVIEYKDEERDYWALAHAGEKPDFHRRESFRLVL